MALSGFLSASRRPARRLAVRDRGGDGQFDPRTGIELTPDGQTAASQFGAFVDARQTLVPGSAARLQNRRVYALSVVQDEQSKLPWGIPDFDFDPLRLGVQERITQ